MKKTLYYMIERDINDATIKSEEQIREETIKFTIDTYGKAHSDDMIDRVTKTRYNEQFQKYVTKMAEVESKQQIKEIEKEKGFIKWINL